MSNHLDHLIHFDLMISWYVICRYVQFIYLFYFWFDFFDLMWYDRTGYDIMIHDQNYYSWGAALNRHCQWGGEDLVPWPKNPIASNQTVQFFFELATVQTWLWLFEAFLVLFHLKYWVSTSARTCGVFVSAEVFMKHFVNQCCQWGTYL